MASLAILGSGFISDFYVQTLQGYRSKDRVIIAHSRDELRLKKFCGRHCIPNFTTTMEEAISHPEVDLVVIGLPNYLHKEAVLLSVKHKKGVLCTKPLGRNYSEALEMMKAVEEAGVFNGYLEDLVYTPKTVMSIDNIRNGSIGKVIWARSRETHPGPHSDWFWDKELAGGGAILDLACHCIEIARSFIGKEIRPVEAMCWAATQVKPIEAEDHAIGLVKYSNGAIGQFEVSWTFRGGLDLRDEVMGTEGTIWLNHFLRTGFELFTTSEKKGYVSEKSESQKGWLFPVGDEKVDLGYVNMFTDMLNAWEEKKRPVETFYDGMVVNAIMDACLLSAKTKKWEPIVIEDWRGEMDSPKDSFKQEYDADHFLVKIEKLQDGSKKIILQEKRTGKISQRVE
jgi:predicted dehydrogenase